MATRRKTNGRQEVRVKTAHANYEAETANYDALIRKYAADTSYPKPEANAVINGMRSASYEAHKTAEHFRATMARLAELRAAGEDANAALDDELKKLELLEDAD